MNQRTVHHRGGSSARSARGAAWAALLIGWVPLSCYATSLPPDAKRAGEGHSGRAGAAQLQLQAPEVLAEGYQPPLAQRTAGAHAHHHHQHAPKPETPPESNSGDDQHQQHQH